MPRFSGRFANPAVEAAIVTSCVAEALAKAQVDVNVALIERVEVIVAALVVELDTPSPSARSVSDARNLRTCRNLIKKRRSAQGVVDRC